MHRGLDKDLYVGLLASKVKAQQYDGQPCPPPRGGGGGCDANVGIIPQNLTKNV